jgi:hypothetical protein
MKNHLEEASDHVENLFDLVRNSQTIPQWIEFKVLCNNKLKEVCKIQKATDVLETLTSYNYVVIINESIFDGLPEDLQKMAIENTLAGVCVSESDSLSIGKPDFTAHTGMLKKFGYEKIDMMRESIKSLFVAQKQKEDEEKALTKGKKGRRGNNSSGGE